MGQSDCIFLQIEKVFKEQAQSKRCSIVDSCMRIAGFIRLHFSLTSNSEGELSIKIAKPDMRQSTGLIADQMFIFFSI